MERKTKWHEAKRAISVLCVGGTRGAFGVHNPQKAGANLAWVPTSLQCFFVFLPPPDPKRLVGDIDIERSRTSKLTRVLEIN